MRHAHHPHPGQAERVEIKLAGREQRHGRTEEETGPGDGVLEGVVAGELGVLGGDVGGGGDGGGGGEGRGGEGGGGGGFGAVGGGYAGNCGSGWRVVGCGGVCGG